jgi:hypothetical protein
MDVHHWRAAAAAAAKEEEEEEEEEGEEEEEEEEGDGFSWKKRLGLSRRCKNRQSGSPRAESRIRA